MKTLLKFVSVETIISFLIDTLASTVKNPASSKAVRLRAVVVKLRDAANDFLNKTSAVPPSF